MSMTAGRRTPTRQNLPVYLGEIIPQRTIAHLGLVSLERTVPPIAADEVVVSPLRTLEVLLPGPLAAADVDVVLSWRARLVVEVDYLGHYSPLYPSSARRLSIFTSSAPRAPQNRRNALSLASPTRISWPRWCIRSHSRCICSAISSSEGRRLSASSLSIALTLLRL